MGLWGVSWKEETCSSGPSKSAAPHTPEGLDEAHHTGEASSRALTVWELKNINTFPPTFQILLAGLSIKSTEMGYKEKIKVLTCVGELTEA